jgi:hypothetical protein
MAVPPAALFPDNLLTPATPAISMKTTAVIIKAQAIHMMTEINRTHGLVPASSAMVAGETASVLRELELP